MIAQIADLLARAGLQLTARELEDILWLASRIHEPHAGEQPVTANVAASDDDEVDDAEVELDEDGARVEQSSSPIFSTGADQREKVSPLYAKDMQGSITGSTLHVPGLSQVPAPSALRRALLPFARRVPSRWQTRLDEEETVTRTFDTGVWMPVFRPVRERRFDLTLVIEECTSAELREDTLRDLIKHFRNYSGLREVRCYRLLGDTPPRLSTLDGKAEYSIEHLKDNQTGDGRHLVLFATDGTSQRWRNGSAQAFLHTVGASTCISLLHLLPRAAWRRTLIGKPDVTLHCERAGAPNTLLQIRLPWWMDADEVQGALPIPVLSLDAASMGTWARSISALGGATMPGVMVSRPAAQIASTLPVAAHTPDKLVSRYRNIASASAYRLAVFLSKTNPTTLSIMRVVQRTMLPDSDEGELAEFLLGGLVTRAETQDRRQERLYWFRDGVADELLKALRFSEEATIDRQLFLVGEALESVDNGTRNLEVAFPTPAGTPSLSEWALPFANVSRRILRGHGRLDAVSADLPIAADSPMATQAPRTALRILHLSDLHCSARTALELSDEVSPFGTVWNQHLRQLANIGGADLVCVSGDLTWTASADDFARLESLFDKTLEALRLPKSRLFVVPGNHDVQRDQDLRNADVRQESSNGMTAIIGLTGAENAAVAGAQSNYRAWLKRYLPHQYAATGGRFADFQLSLPGWIVPVHVVGIDSAWMTSFSTGAVISSEQLHALERKSTPGITIAIMHHLPEQLQRQRHVRERLERSNVDLLLHGPGPSGSMITVSSTTGMVSSGVALSNRRDQQPTAFHVIDYTLALAQRPVFAEATAHEWLVHASSWVTKPAERILVNTSAEATSTPTLSEIAPQHVFVGHVAELERLHHVLGPVKGRSGLPARLMISGHAGVGKTTLFQRFARESWPDGADREGGYVALTANGAFDFEDQLLKKMGSKGIKNLLSRKGNRHTLLVIDDVDSPNQMEAAHQFASTVPGCSVLLIGRFLLNGAAKSITWEVMELTPLSLEESARMLSLLLNATSSAVAQSDVDAIVAALGGAPSLVRLVADYLAEPSAAARLLAWLSPDHAVNLSPAQYQKPEEFAWLLRALEPIFENRWRVELDEEIVQVLSALAHGPFSGFSTSLGMALSGIAIRAADAATIGRFTLICTRAEESSVLRKEGRLWRFATPAVAAWLRARGAARRDPALRRWSDWLAIRMAAPPKSRARLWAELNELPVALIEWLDTCPPDPAELVRPVCVPYAVANGGLIAWQHFCRRILQTYPADHPASADWYLTLAELTHANGEQELALKIVDDYVALKRKTTKPGNQLQSAIFAATDLRYRILADQRRGENISVRQLSEVVETGFQVDSPPELRPYQDDLVDAASAATLLAEPGTRYIGLVVQTERSGASATLAAYLEACRYSNLLEDSNIVVVADRTAIVRQLVHVLKSRSPGLEVIEPQTVNELASLFRTKNSPIVVTTEQKLRHLQGTYGGKRLLVAFALRRPSRSLIESLPQARMIVFGNESLTFKSSPARRLGPVIASYRLEDAIRDGYFALPKIKRYDLSGIFWNGHKLDHRAGDLSETGIKMVAENILKDWSAREATSPDKRLLIVKNVVDALSITEILSADVSSINTDILVLTGGVPFMHAILDKFRASKHNALLVTTAAMTLGLPLDGVDVCYIAAHLNPTILLKIESFTNRPGPEGKIGEIVDFASNDWEILGLPM